MTHTLKILLVALVLVGIGLCVQVTARAQILPPANPVTLAPAKDYGASGQCLYLPTTGTAGNFNAGRAMDCVLIRTDATGPQVLQDFTIGQSRDAVTNYVKSRSAAINGLTIQRFTISARKRGIYLRGPVSNVAIRDGVIVGQGVNTNTGDIPMGVMLGKSQGTPGTGPRDVVIERVVSRAHLADYDDYTNADGFTTERDVTNVTFRDTVAEDNTDGCYDLKNLNSFLERTMAARCRYGYRLWNTGTASYMIAEDNKAAIQMAASSTNWTIDYLDVRGTGRDIQVNVAKGTLVIKACSAPVRVTGSASAIAATHITLGQGCKPGDAPVPLPAIANTDLKGVCAFATALNDNNHDGIIDLGAANRAKCQGVPRVKLIGKNRAGQFVYDRLAA